MPRTVHRPVVVQLLFLAAAILGACATPGLPTRPDASPTLVPLTSPTASSTGGTPAPTVAPIPSPGPSPTPFTHTVQAKDTLLAIAARYGLTLGQLEAANPGIDPRILSIGQAIVIPAPGEGGQAIVFATSTPYPLELSEPRCYRAVSGSLNCLMTARNGVGAAMEGLMALVSLVGPDGKPLLTQTAYSPVSLLPAAKMTVLSAFFPAPAPAAERVVAELVSSVPVGDPSGRYAAVIVERAIQEPAEDRLSWRVRGELQLSPEAAGAGTQASVVLLALDSLGEVVGFAKWESLAGLVGGAQVPYDLVVFSLGPPIERVEILAEAQLNAFPTMLAPTP
jgi:LysM repeat protein